MFTLLERRITSTQELGVWAAREHAKTELYV